MPRVARLASERVETRALVLRRTATGDADLLVTAFTEAAGVLTLSARAARRTSSKLGALEPIHTLRVVLTVHPGRDVAKLSEARIERARTRLLADSVRLDAAFRALVWARSVLAPHQVEPEVFHELERTLDALEAGADADLTLAQAGLRVLAGMGYGLDLDACILCGRACAETSAAFARPSAGGLVCRACGGGAPSDMRLSGTDRQLARRLFTGAITPDGDARALVDLVDAAFGVHAPRRSVKGP